MIETPGSGGAETIFVELARGLHGERWRSVTAVPGPGWVCDAVRVAGLDPIFTPLAQGTIDIRYLVQLAALIRRHRVGLIQAHLLGGAVYGALAGFLCRVPVVATLHGIWDLNPSERFVRTKLKIIQRTARQVVFVSDSLRRAVSARFPFAADRVTVIPNGIDTSVFAPGRSGLLRAELGVREDEFLVGAVGNVRPDKAYAVLLQAAALARREAAGIRFVVVGEASGRHVDELVALRDSLGLHDALQFTGFRSDIHRVMGDLDAYVSSSRAEGFSLTTVQAMACGVPVVATRSGGPEEIVSDGATGLLVEVDAPAALAGALLRVQRDVGLRSRLVAGARSESERRFSLRRMLADYDRLYRQCAKGA
jgi:glycosyltransferase involved in cell wall biosynthesis